MLPRKTNYNYINWEAFLSYMRDKYAGKLLEELLVEFEKLFVSAVETSINRERASLLGYILRENNKELEWLQENSSKIKETLSLD